MDVAVAELEIALVVVLAVRHENAASCAGAHAHAFVEADGAPGTRREAAAVVATGDEEGGAIGHEELAVIFRTRCPAVRKGMHVYSRRRSEHGR
jgi:hypothetical protein